MWSSTPSRSSPEAEHLRTDSTARYSVEWDTTAFPEGMLAVTAVAYDLAGNRSSARVSITVRNRQDRTPPHVTVAGAARGDSARWAPTRTGHVHRNRIHDVAPIDSVSFRIHDEYGRVQPVGSASVTGGRFSITVLLEATRRGQDLDGRRYLLSVTHATSKRMRRRRVLA